METNIKEKTGLIETILFLENEPVDLNTLSKITKLNKDVLIDAIKQLKQEYNKDIHGIELVEFGGEYSFMPKNNLCDSLKNHYTIKNTKKYSRAALETLAIIAYSQPITKAEIENIRGIAPDGMIKILMDSNMIKEVGKKDVPGKPFQYGTTKDFLKKFHLSSISELPKLDELDDDKFKE